MKELLTREMIAAIHQSDPLQALALLKEHEGIFYEPVAGIIFHAEALYAAIKNANVTIVRYLLSLPIHSDIAFFQFCGNTPVGLAVEENRPDLMPYLLQKTDKSFALHMAVKLDQLKAKALLMKCGTYSHKLLALLNLA